jgi:L-aminopeptidase/D-esterase-like protein
VARLLNLITDVPGLAVGNAEDRRVRTGVTVVLTRGGAVAAVATGGGAPGTSETDLLDPSCLIERIDAIVLAGGSVFGLEAAGPVRAVLSRRKRGLRVGPLMVPIVPTAILADLGNGGDKSWGENPPYRRLGRRALAAASRRFKLGNAGAGYGARAGRFKGGLGSASYRARDGFTVGALAAVNSLGATTVPGTAQFWAAPFEQGGEFGGGSAEVTRVALDTPLEKQISIAANTTIAVVATDVALTKAQARRVAIMAQDGFARAIRPVHTPFDGDCVFVLSTGTRKLKNSVMLARIGALAADCLARAIARGVYEAESLGTSKSYRDTFGVARKGNRAA